MHDPISRIINNHCTVLAVGLYPVEGRGFVYLLDGRIQYVPTRSIEKHLGVQIIELIDSDLKSYNPLNEYVLLAIKGGNFQWVGTRDIEKLERDNHEHSYLDFNL
jgi:hypothetical protein